MPQSAIRFAEFELDPDRCQLRRQGRNQKLERIPMELLTLLVENQGKVVSRQAIVDRLWGKDVFLETDHGINTAINKIRRVLRDDPENPRFVQTVFGKGYRFLAETSAVAGLQTPAPATPLQDKRFPIRPGPTGGHLSRGPPPRTLLPLRKLRVPRVRVRLPPGPNLVNQARRANCPAGRKNFSAQSSSIRITLPRITGTRSIWR
jgi:DNA-binding winged helix-turn-helix (wHTH) protein